MAKKAAKKAAVRRPTKKEIDEIIGDAAPPVPRKQAPRKKVKKPTAATPTKDAGADALPPGHRLVKDVVIPPYPRELEDKLAGDKTPAVMDWYEKNHPKAFEALYANRVTPRGLIVG